ncbi:hypothetical protein AKO1_007682, partial [Acrasis kona]
MSEASTKFHPEGERTCITSSHQIQTTFMNSTLLAYRHEYIPQDIADKVLNGILRKHNILLNNVNTSTN